jgi:hypothetical protein
VRAQVDRFARPRDLALEDAIRIFACGDADERTGSNFSAPQLSNIGEYPDFLVLRHPVKQGAPVRHKIADVDMSLGDDPIVGGGDYRRMGFTGAGAADQHDIALLSKESAAGKIAHQGLVDWRAIELEVVEILGEWQLGNGELVFARASLLLVDLGGE